MIVRCLYNTGESLRPFEYQSLKKNILGRFGVTGYGEYKELDIGRDYLVMGVVVLNLSGVFIRQ